MFVAEMLKLHLNYVKVSVAKELEIFVSKCLSLLIPPLPMPGSSEPSLHLICDLRILIQTCPVSNSDEPSSPSGPVQGFELVGATLDVKTHVLGLTVNWYVEVCVLEIYGCYPLPCL